MNKKNFDLWMTSIDDRYLEEALEPPKKKNSYRSIALIAAACLVLVCTGMLLRHALLPSDNITRERFTQDGAKYTMLSCETEEPQNISGRKDTENSLIWTTGGLEFKLCSTKDVAWVSWYDSNTKTQWCLSTDASTLALLTTASEIVEELGYNVAIAPEAATDITYDAFRINNLAVAETTFLLDGIRYSYRMAATYETSLPFADISGTGTNYENHITSKVGWCPAELYYTETGAGKIIWFDIVPGLLYSLSMENGASEKALLTPARELFSPAQDAADW